MVNDSDPDYDPSESEDDSNGDEDILRSSRSPKRYRSDSDEENDSYYPSESISKKTKLMLKSNDKDSSFESSEFSGTLRPQHVAFIYLCSFCFFQTPFQFNLKMHSKRCKKSNSKKYWVCPKCDVKYTLEDLLDEDSVPIDQDSIDKHVFHCPVCSFGVDEKSEAVILEKVYPTAKHLSCPQCKVKISNVNALKKHLIHEHDVTILYKCQYCEYSTSESERLQDHGKSHADLQEMGCIQCSHCNLEFFTMSEVKTHMKHVQWENEGNKDLVLEEEDGDSKKVVVKVEEDFGSFPPEEEKVNFGSLDKGNIRNRADIGKWQLKCTLCRYVNYSEASCQRHVKNKHPLGHSVVRFDKYHENEFKGSINIGKIKDEGRLKMLDWTQSDEEDIPEETVSAARNNQVITIQIGLDAEDKNKNQKPEVAKKEEKTSSVKAGRQRSFNCTECNYQARSKLHLSFHQLLIHEIWVENGVIKCPKQHCKFSTRNKAGLRSHIKKLHKLRIDMFYAPDLKCPDCVYTAEKPVHLLLHKAAVHKVRPTKNPAKLGSRRSLEDAGTVHEVQLPEPVDVQYSRCRQCDDHHEATYHAAWHKFKCHSDNSELRKWRLKCMVCNYKNSVKLDCHRHGLQHKIPHVKFQKYYDGKLKGAVGFRYSQTEINLLKLKVETSDNDKVSMTQNKNVAPELHGNKVDEAGGVGKSNDSSDMLQKKAEFFTCDRCNYETTCESYLPLHDLLVHGAPISSNSKYQCIECNKFESKYRHSFKRHLERCHSYNTDKLYTKHQVDSYYRTERKVKVEKLSGYNCQLCACKFHDKYLLHWHMFKGHRDKTELMKWLIRCKLCSYETYSKKYAQVHASVRHSDAKKSVTVKFDKYYENEFGGNFVYQIGQRQVHKCLKCNYAAISWEMLRHHYRRHDVRRAKKASTKANEREEIYLPSSEEHERIESVQGEANSHNEIEQNEIIRIEITSDGDAEANESEDLSENGEFEPNEDSVPDSDDDANGSEDLSPELDEDSVPSKRHKTYSRKQVIATSAPEKGAEGTNIDDASRNEGLLKHKADVRDNEADKRKDPSQNLLKKDEKALGDSIVHVNHKKITALPEPIHYCRNKCIHRGCKYTCIGKRRLKAHCLKVHKDNKKKLDRIFLKINKYECRSCKFRSPLRKVMRYHLETAHGIETTAPRNYPFVCQKCKNGYEDRYLLATHMLKEHRDKTELSKWSLRCQLCSYETGYTRNANKHGLLKHRSAFKPVVVQFQKFYENVFEGTFTYRYAIRKILGCRLCKYVTNVPRNLREHLMRHRKDNFRPRPQVVIKEQTSNEEAKPVRGQRREADFGFDETRRKTDSGSYNRQQILDIIGLPGVEVKTAEDILVGKCNDNDAEENLKLVVNGEVITIEITPDENKSTLNSFTGEFVTDIDEAQSASPETSFPKSKSFKCSKIGCKYSFGSLKEVTEHIKSCTHKNSRRIRQKFTCHLCKDVMTIRSSLQDHCDAHASALNNPELVVVFSEHMNDRFTCDIEIKANNRQDETKRKGAGPQRPAKVWYKCCMCGSIVVTKVSLKNHTNIHAREDDNFNLKVRFSRYCDEKSDGTIVMHADPNYEPRRKKPARSPEPEYDISLPVFGCDECNYKTNDEEALKKHKNLHWTPEKAALFKAKKWFTCSVCFFHCFDLEKFNEHCEWHKKHYTNTGGIGKMGKDSWFLK